MLLGSFGWWARFNSPELRDWLWRIAALKFLLPFSLPASLGSWLGFPVRHSAVAPPAWLVHAADVTRPWMTPAESLGLRGWHGAVALLLVLIATAFCGVRIGRQLKADQQARPEAYVLRPLGFLKSAALAAFGLGAIAAPVLSGALRDRVLRQEALAVDTARLRHVAISLSETPHRFGMRTEVTASADGVLIHHINLQDLVALVYGIEQFEVFGGALPWLEEPYYDVRIAGQIHAPEIFDPYSLRQPVTDYLSHEYGVAIRVNGSCQEPCLNQESITVERLPWKLANPTAKD
ncbi:MAG TPA: hypothetical protein VMZ90_06280 [Vicinamibacterales bacterium]|nr:hypothetical protein [Vicinamibacterales bacterium]